MMKFYKKKTKVKIKICPECMGSNVNISYDKQDLTIDSAWEPVQYYVPLIHCEDCDKISEALETLEATHDASCVAMGLLPPDEIKRIRKKLGFGNAVDFAKLLEVGDATVKRWESRGAFPNKVSVRAMQVVLDKGVEYFKSLKTDDALCIGEIEKVESAELINFNDEKVRRAQIFSSLENSDPEVFTNLDNARNMARMKAGLQKRRMG